MRKTWIGTAAAAALATAFAIPGALAQETQQGKQAPATMGTGQHRETGKGQMGEAAGQPGAPAQSDRSMTGAEPSQGQKPRTGAMKGEGATGANREGATGMNREGAGTEQPGNRMQPGNRTMGENKEKAGEGRTEPQGNRENGQIRGNAEKSTGSAQTGTTSEPGRMGQAGNRERAGQAGGEMSGRDVQIQGKANIPHEKAAEVARTLRTSGGVQRSPNINVDQVTVGANLPGDVIINPLPPSIVEIVPEFRGYDFFVIGDEVVIVDPATRQVVEIIEDVG